MWADIGIAALLLIGVYCFLRLVGWQARLFTRKTTRRAEDLYGQFADSPQAQRKQARERDGDRTGAGGHSPSVR